MFAKVVGASRIEGHRHPLLVDAPDRVDRRRLAPPWGPRMSGPWQRLSSWRWRRGARSGSPARGRIPVRPAHGRGPRGQGARSGRLQRGHPRALSTGRPNRLGTRDPRALCRCGAGHRPPARVGAVVARTLGADAAGDVGSGGERDLGRGAARLGEHAGACCARSRWSRKMADQSIDSSPIMIPAGSPSSGRGGP